MISEDMVSAVKTKEGSASRRGFVYETANGETIPNLGEKQFVAESEEGARKKITAHVADVNKGLLSVTKIVAAGDRVVFDGNSYLEDRATGEKMWLTEAHGVYMLKMWVESGQPF